MSFFKGSIISNSLIPNEVRRRCDQIISIALLRVRLVNMEAGSFGLIVPTKYIFITAFVTNDKEFNMAGVFLVFLHEMAHYIKRYDLTLCGDIGKVKSSNGEGGFQFEIELFGKILTKLYVDAVRFLMNELNESSF